MGHELVEQQDKVGQLVLLLGVGVGAGQDRSLAVQELEQQILKTGILITILRYSLLN